MIFQILNTKYRILNTNSAFTLAELLVTVSIIAIIVAASVVSLNGSLKSARDNRRRVDLSQVKTALELYREENGSYPSTGGVYWGKCYSYHYFVAKDITGPNGYIPNLAPAYIPVLPIDPLPERQSKDDECYAYRSDGVDYKMLAHQTPEGSWDAAEDFYDPCRPTWSWQISSSPKARGVTEAGCQAGGWFTSGW